MILKKRLHRPEELQPKNQVECSKRKNLDKLVVLLSETLSVSSHKGKVKIIGFDT